jgi:hypothetical protein
MAKKVQRGKEKSVDQLKKDPKSMFHRWDTDAADTLIPLEARKKAKK